MNLINFLFSPIDNKETRDVYKNRFDTSQHHINSIEMNVNISGRAVIHTLNIIKFVDDEYQEKNI